MLKTHLSAIAFSAALFVGAAPALAQGNAFAKLPVLQDKNPDPDIVEVDLRARVHQHAFSPGKPSKVYAYNGFVPGPLIKAKLGQTLIVHFTNDLPEPTTVHWHGLRVPATMDGSLMAQRPIPPGGSFTYEFELQDAGLYWYHPHFRGFEQVEKGPHGAILIEDPDEDVILPVKKQNHHVLELDDVLLDAGGEIQPAYQGGPEAMLLEKLNGRIGNKLLVNGKELPFMVVKRGDTQRWRLVNVSNARFFRVHIPGHKLTRVGGDSGLMEEPIRDLDSVTLTPGERADILFTPNGRPGSEIFVEWQDPRRGLHTVEIEDGMVKMGHAHHERPSVPILKLKFAGGNGKGHVEAPDFLKPVEEINVSASTPEQTLKFGHRMPMANGMVEFTINGKTMSEVAFEPGAVPKVAVGETQIWNLVNMTGADHPFHLHGFFFRPLSIIRKNHMGQVVGVHNFSKKELKDTVNMPRRPGHKGSVTITRVAVSFDPGVRTQAETVAKGGMGAVQDHVQSGGWLFHCHILEHADNGMASYVQVE